MKCYPCRLISPLTRAGIALFLVVTSTSSLAHLFMPNLSIPHQISVEPDCNIKFIDPHNGIIKNKPSSNASYLEIPPFAPFTTEDPKINLICISSDDSRVGFHGISTFNSRTKKWILDWSRIIGSTQTKREEQWQYRWYRANYKEMQLKSINSQGYAIVDRTQTGDGTIPTEFDKRAQGTGPIFLSFCLIRPPKALCGDGRVGQKEEGIKGDSTPHALKLIRSIEFIN